MKGEVTIEDMFIISKSFIELVEQIDCTMGGGNGQKVGD